MFEKLTTPPPCPRCTSRDFRRTRRKDLYDYLVLFLLIRPYRCRECTHRFYWLVGAETRRRQVIESPYCQPLDLHSETAPTSAPPPEPDPVPVPVSVPVSDEADSRRQHRRIQMSIPVLIRRASDPQGEVLEVLDISRGGFSFSSSTRYALNETLLVTLHYRPGQPGLEGPATIVKVWPAEVSTRLNYGARFEQRQP